jgi:hypothetical protein
VNKYVGLRVSVEIIVPLAFEPQRLHFGRKTRQEITPMTLTGTGDLLSTVEILSAAISDPDRADCYTIALEDSGTGADRRIQFTITPTEKLPAGRFNDKLEIHTNLPDDPIIDVNISGEILGAVDILPRTMVLRSSSGDVPYTGSIRLISTGGSRFQVLSAQCSDSRIETTVSEPEDDGSIRIDMRLPPEFSERQYKSELFIRTDLADTPFLTVPVYVQRRSSRPAETIR